MNKSEMLERMTDERREELWSKAKLEKAQKTILEMQGEIDRLKDLRNRATEEKINRGTKLRKARELLEKWYKNGWGLEERSFVETRAFLDEEFAPKEATYE